MKKAVFFALFLTGLAAFVHAQPRPVGKTTVAPAAAPKPAPPSFEAKYEGGMFGYSRREEGTLRFDDMNSRLVFFGKDGQEKFAVPYASMMVIYPQSRSVRSTTGTVVSAIPLPGAGLAGLIREKRRYLIINFSDPDVERAQGVLSFKLENKALLDSVIHSIAEKAQLTQRGDAFYRPKRTGPTI
jgi:hypothetical protein